MSEIVTKESLEYMSLIPRDLKYFLMGQHVFADCFYNFRQFF